MANKDIKKDQEQTGIENLNESLTSFSSKVEKHKKVILGVVGGIVVVVLAGFGWYFFNKHQNKKSSEAYSTAVVNSIKEAQKAAATSNNPDSVFSATMIKNLQKVAQAEAGKTGANLANLQLANLYYSEGNAKKALEVLDAVDIDEPVMEMNALTLKGDCYVDLNKLNDAMSAYDEVIEKSKEDNPELAARVLMKKAVVLDSQKKYADALAIYEQVLKDYPQYANSDVEAYAERERALAGK